MESIHINCKLSAIICSTLLALVCNASILYAQRIDTTRFEGSITFEGSFPGASKTINEYKIKGDSIARDYETTVVPGSTTTLQRVVHQRGYLSKNEIYSWIAGESIGGIDSLELAKPIDEGYWRLIPPTGEVATIAGFDARAYELKGYKTPTDDLTLWLTTYMPPEVKTVYAAVVQQLPESGGDLARILMSHGLFPVRIELKTGEQLKASYSLVKIERHRVDPEAFQLPVGVEFRTSHRSSKN